MEQTQGVPAGASSAESPCQFAIDGGGNLYRRYSEPVCASCVPVMKLTDKWESARVADFNAGWNACRNAMLSAAPQAQPVEAEQTSVVTHEPVAVVVTWRVPGGTETGVEWMDAPPPDGTKLYVSVQPVEAEAVEDLMTKIQAFGLACYQHEAGAEQIAMQDEIRADLIALRARPVAEPQPAQPVREPMSLEQVYALLPQRLRSVEFGASEVFSLGDVRAAISAAIAKAATQPAQPVEAEQAPQYRMGRWR